MAVLVLLSASARARIVRVDLLRFALDGLLLKRIVLVRSHDLCGGLTFNLLLDPYMVEHAERLFLDHLGHLLEHLEAVHTVLDLRIMLRISRKTDSLAKLFHIIDVIHPSRIDYLKKHDPFEFTHPVFTRERLLQFLFLLLIQLPRLLLQIPGKLLLIHGLQLFLLRLPNRDDRSEILAESGHVHVLAFLVLAQADPDLPVNHGIDHAHDDAAHIFAVQNFLPLLVDDLTLIIVDAVKLKQVLADTEVVAFDLLLGPLNRGAQHLVLDLLAFRNAQRLKSLDEPLRSEQTHQVVFQGNVETALARVSLTSGTSAQLIVDTP